MQNYFNYFTEIEERFQQRRGSLLMLSTLDWALIETWREAGLPIDAVLRGIDQAFDKHDAKMLRAMGRVRRINGLAWCSQSVMEAVEQASNAALGAASADAGDETESGFENDRVASYLEANAARLENTTAAGDAQTTIEGIAARLKELAAELRSNPIANLEDLDRTLTVLEERVFAVLMTCAAEDELVTLREHASRELAPYRGKMQAVQIRQVQQQFLQKKLLEAHGLPRLSLFYMSHQ